MATTNKLKIRLVKSMYGKKPGHVSCVKGLGLRRINHEVVREDTPENRGMINKISYMLQVEEVAL